MSTSLPMSTVSPLHSFMQTPVPLCGPMCMSQSPLCY